MITINQTHSLLTKNPKEWRIPLMDFVDDFREHKDLRALEHPFPTTDPRLDALLASTAESLCQEMGLNPPPWLDQVPSSPTAWFVSGFKNIQAIALAESPLHFRLRKIFVLDNFLARA